MSIATKQFNPDLFFKCLDLEAKGWRTQMKHLGAASEMKRLRDEQERSDMP
jgi:hypothetical protein